MATSTSRQQKPPALTINQGQGGVLHEIYNLLAHLRNTLRHPPMDSSTPSDVTNKRLVDIAKVLHGLNRLVNGNVKEMYGERADAMIQNYAEMQALFDEIRASNKQELTNDAAMHHLQSLYGTAEIFRQSAVDMELGVGPTRKSKPPPLSVTGPTPRNPEELYVRNRLEDIYSVIGYMKNIIRFPPMNEHTPKSVTNQRLVDLAKHFDQLELLLDSERLRFYRGDMTRHLIKKVDECKKFFQKMRYNWANGTFDNHYVHCYLVDLIHFTELLRSDVINLELGFDPANEKLERKILSVIRASKPRPLNLGPGEEGGAREQMRTMLRLVEELRNIIRHPPTTEDTPLQVTMQRCNDINQKLAQIRDLNLNEEFIKQRRQLVGIWDKELDELTKYVADFMNMVSMNQFDNSMYRETLKNMLALTDRLRVELTIIEYGFDPDLNVDALEDDLDSDDGYVADDDMDILTRGVDLLTRDEPQIDPQFEAFRQSHGGEFGSQQYQQFLRDNMVEGSRLALWRESPAKGARLPPVGSTLTVAPGGLPTDANPWVGVTVDVWPGTPVVWLDLASVFLLLQPVNQGATSDLLSLQAFGSLAYLDYLMRSMDYGRQFLLWRDDEYSGLKAGEKLLVEPSHLVLPPVGEQVVSVTREDDPTQQVHKVNLANCCINMPYHIQVDYM